MRIIITALLVLFVGLQYMLWLGDFGYVRLEQIQQSIDLQQRANEQLELRNQRLHAEVLDLKKGTAALEERARSQLGMIKQGETFYQVLENQDVQSGR